MGMFYTTLCLPDCKALHLNFNKDRHINSDPSTGHGQRLVIFVFLAASYVPTHLNETLDEVLWQSRLGLFFCAEVLEYVCELFPEIECLLKVF